MTTRRKLATKPKDIPEGYLWCNDLLHVGDNPWKSDDKSSFFAPKRAQCKTCYTRQQNATIKNPDLPNTINLEKMIKNNVTLYPPSSNAVPEPNFNTTNNSNDDESYKKRIETKIDHIIEILKTKKIIDSDEEDE